MSVKAIRIYNILSFSDMNISNIEDVNCIIGKNNVGKSNLLKCLKYFYEKLDDKKVIPLELNSKYTSSGYITITYDTERIKKIVKRKRASKSKFLTHIWKSFFSENDSGFASVEGEISLTLKIASDDSISWSIKSKEKRELIKYLYPFFYIETRHIDLYDWDLLWHLVGTVKPIGSNLVDRDELVEHLNDKISKNNNSYVNHVNLIQQITDTKGYTKKEKFLNYIKVGLEGQTFHIDGESIATQSDGTNSHKFILLFLKLLISLSRTSYIHPFVYIDEPEIGLHPKKNEDLISEVYKTYLSYRRESENVEVGKYKTPNPKIFFASHSPNILKQIIRLYGCNQQVLHFSKNKKDTVVRKMNSQYDDVRFVNIFSDNEARLFFSSFIFFVEGPTELELFRNKSLQSAYDFLKDVDIYPMNHLTLRYVNPSYSNVAIPYLVLYDSDVLLKVDFTNKRLTLKVESINIDSIEMDARSSYYGSNKYKQNNDIIQLKRYLSDCKLEFDSYKLSFVNLKIKDFVNSINKNILNFENIHLTTTTIEHCLINDGNVDVFESWLFHVYSNTLLFNNNKNIVKAYGNVKKRDVDTQIGALCITKNGRRPESTVERRILKIIQLRKIIEFNAYLKSNNFELKDKVILYRLLFGGKCETLLSRFNDEFRTQIPGEYIEMLKKVRTVDFLWAEHLFSKTSGWVSQYLDYCAEVYIKSKPDLTITKFFDIYFQELSVIIYKLRLDRGER